MTEKHPTIAALDQSNRLPILARTIIEHCRAADAAVGRGLCTR